LGLPEEGNFVFRRQCLDPVKRQPTTTAEIVIIGEDYFILTATGEG